MNNRWKNAPAKPESCVFPDCGKPAAQRLFCRTHYDWLWRRDLHDVVVYVCPCGRPMVRHDVAPPPGACRHEGRGLCARCYRKAQQDGSLVDRPRLLRHRDEVLEDWPRLRAEGYTKRQAAERLGMSFSALDRMLSRARSAGDPRAVTAA